MITSQDKNIDNQDYYFGENVLEFYAVVKYRQADKKVCIGNVEFPDFFYEVYDEITIWN